MFTFFDHTGDVGVELEGGSPSELFEEAARALAATLTDAADLAPAQSLRIVLRHESLDLLLVDWLSELLYRFEAEGFLPAEINVQLAPRAGGWGLTAEVRGEPDAAARVPVKVLVKAVTYHGLLAAQQGDRWCGRVVFDV
jgi:SHS2 domain-containing protein